MLGTMPVRLWSLPLDGDRRAGVGLLPQASHDRVIVSTYRTAEASVPGGIHHSKTTTLSHPGQVTTPGKPVVTYVNAHALRCSAIDRSGAVAWTRSDLSAQGVAPDGRIAAKNDRHDAIVLDPEGRELERQSERGNWGVIGWRDGGPLLGTSVGAIWVEPFAYALFGHHLHRYDDADRVITRVSIPRTPFQPHVQRHPWLSRWPEGVVYPGKLDLHHDPYRHRLIAHNWTLPAWMMAIGLEGEIEWVTLLGDACCNAICFLGDSVIVHTSSCGGRLSFLSPDGVVFQTQQLEKAPGYAFPDGGRQVCVTVGDQLHGFDACGVLQWTLDVPGIERAVAHAGVIYAVTEGPGRQRELTAFDSRA